MGCAGQIVVLAGILLPQLISAQAPPDAHPAFEVVSIKPSEPGVSGNHGISFDAASGRVTGVRVTTVAIIQFAFDMEGDRISGGPAWASSVEYDLTGKPEYPVRPTGDNMDYFRQEIQAMLEDRFHLVFHRESKEMPVFALVAAKGGIKLKDSGEPTQPTDMRMSGGNGRMAGQKVRIGIFTRVLTQMVGRPVIDQTNLTGHYDFDLHWNPDESHPDAQGPSIFTALEEQLGLRLEAQKASVPTIVIDHVERPSDN